MATNITYNGNNLPQPLPLVSRSEAIINYGEKWGTQYQYTLQGSLINCSGYSELIDQQSEILNIFNKDFQNFSISDDGVDINYPVCFIENIDFGVSDYLFNIPYSITISTYPSGLFEENGILDPVDNWEFQETDDKQIRLTHTVSARGFQTSSVAANSLRNAIGFVQQRTGLINEPSLQFITGAGDYILSSQIENLNRLNSSYEITETYIKDQTSTGSLKRYSIDLTSGLNGFINVNINGSLNGGVNADLNVIRSEYHNFNIFGIVQDAYVATTTNNDLNITPLSSGINEDPYNKIISFDLSYDNNPDPLVSVNYSIDVQESDSFSTISVNGSIVGRGDSTNKWGEIQNYYYTGLDLYSLATSGYSWKNGIYSVNQIPITSGVTFDSYKSEISFRTSYNDAELPENPAFKDFDYEVSFTPSIRRITSSPLLAQTGISPLSNSDDHYITDLGYYNKVEMNLNGTAIFKDTLPVEESVAILEDEIYKIFLVYSNQGSKRTNSNITYKPPFGKTLSFNYAWMFDGQNVNDTGNYALTLNLDTKQ